MTAMRGGELQLDDAFVGSGHGVVARCTGDAGAGLGLLRTRETQRRRSRVMGGARWSLGKHRRRTMRPVRAIMAGSQIAASALCACAHYVVASRIQQRRARAHASRNTAA